MSELIHYWQEFLLLATAHAFAVISPGPDFAVVMKQSLLHGRKTAMITSCGIGAAISVHVTYSLLGLELITQANDWMFRSIQIAGALYLGYLGSQAIRSSKKTALQNGDVQQVISISSGEAFRQGFITNALNPKATVFFLSLFTGIVGVDTPLSISMLYAIWMIVATAAWFIFLSFILSQQRVRNYFANFGHWLDRIFGMILLSLAVLILISIL